MNRMQFIKTSLCGLVFSVIGKNIQADDAPPPSEPETPLKYIYSLSYADEPDVGQIRRERQFESISEVKKRFNKNIVDEGDNFVKISRKLSFNHAFSKVYVIYTNDKELILKIIGERLE